MVHLLAYTFHLIIFIAVYVQRITAVSITIVLRVISMIVITIFGDLYDCDHYFMCAMIRFCQGCVIPCDSDCVGRLVGRFLAVDWDNTTLHLKYLLAQEKVKHYFWNSL